MKTNKQRLLNLVITLSVGINLVMLGGVGYIAAIDNHIDHLFSALNTPVVIYLPKPWRVRTSQPQPSRPLRSSRVAIIERNKSTPYLL